MMTKEVSTTIVKTLGAVCRAICDTVKMHHFLINSNAWFRQTNYIVIMTKEGYIKKFNFMIP